MNQLTKQSSDSDIKKYFMAVLRLAKSSEQFPVNLEEVWPLVYGKKSDAVQALQRDFIEDVDFQGFCGKIRKTPMEGDRSMNTSFPFHVLNTSSSRKSVPSLKSIAKSSTRQPPCN